MIEWDCASWSSKLEKVPAGTNEEWPIGPGPGHKVELRFATMSSVLALEGACFYKWKQCQQKLHFLK